MARILVCDDEPSLRKVIKKYAEYKDFEAEETSNGQEAIDKLKQSKFDILVLDIMMPVVDGFEALKEIRTFSNIPVIMLTARAEEYDKVLGFELGVDDYVTKPFSNSEIILRIEAILRRSNSTDPVNTEKNTYQYKDLFVDMDAYKVLIGDKNINLSLKELELLFYLIQNKNIALTRSQILSEVWGYDFFGDDRTLDTHIKTLRKALGDYKDLIVTVRGLGYRFDG